MSTSYVMQSTQYGYPAEVWWLWSSFLSLILPWPDSDMDMLMSDERR